MKDKTLLQEAKEDVHCPAASCCTIDALRHVWFNPKWRFKLG